MIKYRTINEGDIMKKYRGKLNNVGVLYGRKKD